MKHLRVRCSIDLFKPTLTLQVKGLPLISRLNVSRSAGGWSVESSANLVTCFQGTAIENLPAPIPTGGYLHLWKPVMLWLDKQSKISVGLLKDVPLTWKRYLPSTWRKLQLFLPSTTLEGRTRHVELITSGTGWHPTGAMSLKDTLSPILRTKQQRISSHLQKLLNRISKHMNLHQRSLDACENFPPVKLASLKEYIRLRNFYRNGLLRLLNVEQCTWQSILSFTPRSHSTLITKRSKKAGSRRRSYAI